MNESRVVLYENYEGYVIPKINCMDYLIALHSMYSITSEMDDYYNRYCDGSNKIVIAFGFGFGYHLQKLARTNIQMKIIVLNEDVYEIAREIVDLDIFFLNPMIEFLSVGDKDFNEMVEMVDDDNVRLIFHMPSIYTCKNKHIKEILTECNVRRNSYLKNKQYIKENIKSNLNHFDIELYEYLPAINKKCILIVAAGPSLKYDIEHIKEIQANTFILCVGTVLKVLLDNCIEPDAVIITDPQPNVINQIEGVEIDVPLICLVSANKQLFLSWYGDKVIAFLDENIEYSKFSLSIETGGSVLTTALDISIKSNAKWIILAGADLAYTDGKTHVEGTQFYSQENVRSETVLKGYHDEDIFTSKNLLMYKKWIEKRIERSDKEVVNMTELGSVIHGASRIEFRDIKKKLKS